MRSNVSSGIDWGIVYVQNILRNYLVFNRVVTDGTISYVTYLQKLNLPSEGFSWGPADT